VALVLLLLVPLSAVAVVATALLGGPVLRAGVDRRAQAIALAGGHTLSNGGSPTAARHAAEAYAARLGVPPSTVTVQATATSIDVTLRIHAVVVRLPGASRVLRVRLVGIARASPSSTQDDRPGVVLLHP
jgi:hypothetical protein